MSRADAAASGGRERLHKIMAATGLGSRRALEKRIKAGEVRVNGKVATPGDTAKAGDLIEMAGESPSI